MAKPKNPALKPKLPKTGKPEDMVSAAAEAFSKATPSKAKKEAPKQEKKEKAIPLPSAKERLAQIKRSEKLKKPFLEDSERFFRMYQGDYSKKGRGKRRDDKMCVNILYSHIEIITPAIFSGFPALKVRPKPKVGESSEQAELRARNMELVISYWFKELAADEILRDVFLDTFFGPAFAEVGWETEIEEREDEQEESEGGSHPLPKVTTIKDRPFLRRRTLRDMTLDPDAPARREGVWMGVREVIKWNAFQASSNYTDKAKAQVKPQLYPRSEDQKEDGDRAGDTSRKEWVEIYTIWDKETRKKYVLTEGYPGYLNSDDEEGQDWPYEMEYKDDPFPICVHDAKRDRDTPYSWSEFKAYESQVVELNRIRQALQIHVKAALPKYIFIDAIGGKQVVNKIMNARSDEAVLVENLEAIKQLTVAEMPSDNFKMSQMAKEDLLDVSGLLEYQGAPQADTATEASIMEGRSKMRKTMRSRLWEQFVVEIGAKLAQLCQQNMDEEIAIEIAGPQGIEWLRVTKEQIQGEFFFDIEPGVMEYKNQAIRMQQMLKLMEVSNGDPNMNRRGMIGKIAKEMDINPEDVIVPIDQLPKPPPPEPTLSIKDIDPLSITDPALSNALVLAALRQNGVDVGPVVDKVTGVERIGSNSPMQKILMAMKGQGGQPGPKPLEPGEAAPQVPGGGKDVADNGLNPNGNMNLPPVVGNLNQGGNPNG